MNIAGQAALVMEVAEEADLQGVLRVESVDSCRMSGRKDFARR